MKNSTRTVAIVLAIIFVSFFSQSWGVDKTKREFYQLTVYHFSTAAQEKVLDNYLQNAWLPAMHKMSIKNIGCKRSKLEGIRS